ncbi:MAG: FHA domain-containing protein [Chloroflexi bacterium]|nr:FHA domain-containing protein [Chloroflexota bacterium]
MQSGVSYRLIVRRGPQPNQTYDLTRDTITIGRDITNDIVINDPECSRHHSRLIRTPNGYTIEDLRSTNGTFVNRQRISGAYQLTNGDLIGLGETVTLMYEVVGADPYGSSGTQMNQSARGGGYQQPPSLSPPPLGQPPQPYSPSAAPPPGYSGQPPSSPPPISRPNQGYGQPPQDGVGPDRNRWILVGCFGVTVVVCCALLGGAIAVEVLDLYCELPILSQFFECTPTTTGSLSLGVDHLPFLH